MLASPPLNCSVKDHRTVAVAASVVLEPVWLGKAWLPVRLPSELLQQAELIWQQQEGPEG